jgi:hypothetical protein
MLGEGRQADHGEEAEGGKYRAGIHTKEDHTQIHVL